MGAWEIGVMWGLAHYGNPEDFYWDVVSGVSAGAINTAGTAGWKPEEVVEMTEYLSDKWYNLTTEDVWVVKPWVTNKHYWEVMNENSVYDDTSALATMKDIMSAKTEFARRVSVGCTDLNSGHFHEWN